MNAITTDAALDEPNPREVIGGNHPPEPTPFEKARDKINDLYDEAKLYLDGEPVSSQGMADDIGNLLNMIRTAEKEAEEARKAEAKPFDDGKAEVQARYAPLIADTKSVKGKTVLAADACKKALAPWLTKQAAEQAERERKLREEAEEKQSKAMEALRAAQASADLEQRENAEKLVADAKKADAVANRAGKETAKAGASVFGRAAGLRTTYRAEVADERDFARHVWANHRAEMAEFLNGLAQRLVTAGRRDLPGVIVHEEKKVA